MSTTSQRKPEAFVCVHGYGKDRAPGDGVGGRRRDNGGHRDELRQGWVAETVSEPWNTTMTDDIMALRGFMQRGSDASLLREIIGFAAHGGSPWGQPMGAAHGERSNEWRAVLLEIDPGYTDVIVRRWQETTGEAVVLERQDRIFDDVAVARSVVAKGQPGGEIHEKTAWTGRPRWPYAWLMNSRGAPLSRKLDSSDLGCVTDDAICDRSGLT